MEGALRQGIVRVLAIIGFAVTMTLRDELSNIEARALVAGIAGVLIYIAFSPALRWCDRQ